MASIGRYVITRELQRRGLTQMLLVRDSRGEFAGDLALKVMRSTGAAGAAASEDAIGSLLNAASLQQNTAGAGARGWAPVFDLGQVDDASYVVYPAYAGSVSTLFETASQPSAAGLANLMAGVAGAMLEAKRVAGRPHGNLSADNILLTAPTSLHRSEVHLTDPTPEIEFNEDAEIEDRATLGQIVYRLVESRMFKAMGEWPLEFAGAWASLGRDGAQICEATNRLLDPELKPGQVPWQDIAALESLR